MLPPWIGRSLDRVPPRLANLVRYASVSAVATVVGLSALALLVGVAHWPPTGANIVATALGTIPSFELNRRWVWRRAGHRSLHREVLPFGGLCFVELVASTVAVHSAAAWTQHAGWGDGVRTLADLVANVSTYGVLWVAQYVVLDRVLFAQRTVPVGGSVPVGESVPVGGPAPKIQFASRSSSSDLQELPPGCVR